MLSLQPLEADTLTNQILIPQWPGWAKHGAETPIALRTGNLFDARKHICFIHQPEKTPMSLEEHKLLSNWTREPLGNQTHGYQQVSEMALRNWSALDMLILIEKVLCGTELKGNAAFIILVLMIHSTSIHQFIISSTSIHNNLYMMSSGEDKRNCRPDFWPIPITPTTRPVPQLFAHIPVFTLFYSLWHWPGGENDCRLGANWDNLVNCICIPASCRGCC